MLTIHDMRSLLECIQFVRGTAVQTAVNVSSTGILIALLPGIAMKLLWSARTWDWVCPGRSRAGTRVGVEASRRALPDLSVLARLHDVASPVSAPRACKALRRWRPR